MVRRLSSFGWDKGNVVVDNSGVRERLRERGRNTHILEVDNNSIHDFESE